MSTKRKSTQATTKPEVVSTKVPLTDTTTEQTDPVVESVEQSAALEATEVPVETTVATEESSVTETDVKETDEVQKDEEETSDVSGASEALEETPESRFPFRVSAELTDFIDQVVEKEGIVAQVLVDNVVAYIDAMTPGKLIEPKTGAIEQVKLYRVIRNLFETQNGNFHMLYALLLKFVDEFSDESSVFNGRYIYRFIYETGLNNTDINAFNAFINMITATAAVSSRAHTVKQINFTKTLAFLPDDAKQRLIAFYQN